MRIRILLLIVLLGFVLKPFNTSAQVAIQDSLALVDLYNSTRGSNWTGIQGWLQNPAYPVKSWTGVKVTGNRVVAINLGSFYGLTGGIPSSIGNLTGLMSMNLGENNITGQIPSSMGNLINLTVLDLLGDKLTGEIPTTIGNLTNLTIFEIGGSFDTIPSEIGNLTNLQDIILTGDGLTGQIPTSIGNLKNLSQLRLGNNKISGEIPSSIGGLKNLAFLYLNNNNLSEAIPDFDSLTKLTVLELNNNGFTFNGMENIAVDFSFVTYAPQSNIPLIKQGNILSVSAGGTSSNDTFRLYKNSVLNATHIGDSAFVITDVGKYSITVTNLIANQLTLYSDTITVDSIVIQICSGGDDSIYSNLTGTSYVWQVNKGSGFVNVTGNGNAPYLGLQNIQSFLYGYQYRCIVDGDTSAVYTLTIGDIWIGTTDSTWENPANWSCGTLPDINTDVIINSGTVVLASNTAVRSISVNPNASFTIATGNNLVVTH